MNGTLPIKKDKKVIGTWNYRNSPGSFFLQVDEIS